MADDGMVKAGPGLHYAWVVLAVTTVVMLASSGVRAAFGVLIKPMETEFGWDRTALSAVASLSFIFNQLGSAVGSFAGEYVYDRFGDYTRAFHSAALVAFAATAMVQAILERPMAPAARTVVPSAAG